MVIERRNPWEQGWKLIVRVKSKGKGEQMGLTSDPQKQQQPRAFGWPFIVRGEWLSSGWKWCYFALEGTVEVACSLARLCSPFFPHFLFKPGKAQPWDWVYWVMQEQSGSQRGCGHPPALLWAPTELHASAHHPRHRDCDCLFAGAVCPARLSAPNGSSRFLHNRCLAYMRHLINICWLDDQM